ncbi:MAG: ORC1-type DNA replication protein [Euryarchaeota archaeon]|nr:ORC1-type DNA replication protein [Euryarchaeota archaeon]
MGNIFEKYLKKTSLFTEQRQALYPGYLPEHLPHREREIDKIAEILSTALEGEKPSNIIIFGKTGTGKTAAVQYVGRELKNANQVYGKSKVKFIYINCETVDTPYSVLQNVGNIFIEKWEDKIPFTGWPIDKIFTTTKSYIDNWNGVVIIVLDEIDKLVAKSGDDILYKIMHMNDILKNSKVSIIGISNELRFTDLLDARVKSRLTEEKMIFAPYDALQLRDILEERAKIAIKNGAVGEDVIQLCAAIAAQEHGDARRAIDLLRISVEIAEREGSDKVMEHHVRQAKNKIELDCVAEAIRTLPLHSKIVLLGLTLAEESGRENLTSGELYNIYRNLATKISHTPLTSRRVSDLITEMDTLGLITANLKSFGRYGRTKVIELAVPWMEAKRILLEDEFLVELKNAKITNQKKLFF